MLTANTAKELAGLVHSWKSSGFSIGFVPTMGALHDGHVSLVRLALERADRVAASIFVNPAQFAPHEDFSAYPRTVEKDLEKLRQSGAHLAYLPREHEIYPDGPVISVKAGFMAKGLESDFRPHFFDGVTTVVHTLFEQVRPDIAIFGEKDFQQLRVIQEMAATHAMPIDIIGAPIVRDEHGLALSSRNAYLSAGEIIIARTLNRVLLETAEKLSSSGLDLALRQAEARLIENGFDKVDYIRAWQGRLLAAAWIGRTRLIDNVEIK
jgi:pantoate--beta-alanine ligase